MSNSEAIALIIVDTQNGFITEHSKHILSPLSQIIDVASSNNQPIIATQFTNLPNSQYIKLMEWSKFMDSPSIDVFPYVSKSIMS